MGAIFSDYGPDDPFYKEGPQRYSLHWGWDLLDQPKKPSPANTAGPQTDGVWETDPELKRQRLKPDPASLRSRPQLVY
jgi:hypothetical protein